MAWEVKISLNLMYLNWFLVSGLKKWCPSPLLSDLNTTGIVHICPGGAYSSYLPSHYNLTNKNELYFPSWSTCEVKCQNSMILIENSLKCILIEKSGSDEGVSTQWIGDVRCENISDENPMRSSVYHSRKTDHLRSIPAFGFQPDYRRKFLLQNAPYEYQSELSNWILSCDSSLDIMIPWGYMRKSLLIYTELFKKSVEHFKRGNLMFENEEVCSFLMIVYETVENNLSIQIDIQDLVSHIRTSMRPLNERFFNIMEYHDNPLEGDCPLGIIAMRLYGLINFHVNLLLSMKSQWGFHPFSSSVFSEVHVNNLAIGIAHATDLKRRILIMMSQVASYYEYFIYPENDWFLIIKVLVDILELDCLSHLFGSMKNSLSLNDYQELRLNHIRSLVDEHGESQISIPFKSSGDKQETHQFSQPIDLNETSFYKTDPTNIKNHIMQVCDSEHDKPIICPFGTTLTRNGCQCIRNYPLTINGYSFCIFITDDRPSRAAEIKEAMEKSKLEVHETLMGLDFWTLNHLANIEYCEFMEKHERSLCRVIYTTTNKATFSDRKIGWAKLWIMMNKMWDMREECEYAVSIDSDAYLRTRESLSAVVDYHHMNEENGPLIAISEEFHQEVLASKDRNIINRANGGFFIIRNTNTGRDILVNGHQGLNYCFDTILGSDCISWEVLYPGTCRQLNRIVYLAPSLFGGPEATFVRHEWFKDKYGILQLARYLESIYENVDVVNINEIK